MVRSGQAVEGLGERDGKGERVMAGKKKVTGAKKPKQPNGKKKVTTKPKQRNWSIIKDEYLLTPPDPDGMWISNEAWCRKRKLPWPGSDKHMRGWKDERDGRWAEFARKAMEKSATRILESETRMKARFYNIASRILRVAEKNLDSLEAVMAQAGSNQIVDREAVADVIKNLHKIQLIMHKAMGLDDIKLGVNLSADAVVSLIRKLPESELQKLYEQFEQMDEGEFDA